MATRRSRSSAWPPSAPAVFSEGEVSDPEALGDSLKELFSKHKLSKTVRVGLASQRVAVRTLRLPLIEDHGELETAIRFQAQDHIPMPLEQAVLDWQVVGHGTGENGERQVEVVAVAARRDMLGGLMQAFSRAGLRPVGIDLSAFGMIRALAGGSYSPVEPGDYVDAPGVGPPAYEQGSRPASRRETARRPPPSRRACPAKLYCNLGDVTNLAVARGSSCLFTRVSPFGVEGIAQKLAERRQLTLEHARQWLVHVGLDKPVEGSRATTDRFGSARRACRRGRATGRRAAAVTRVLRRAGGSRTDRLHRRLRSGDHDPGLVRRLQHDLGQRFEVGRPRALAHLDDATSARLTLSLGLALGE